MSGPGDFVSVFRKNGRPILPPVMTPTRKAEMQRYKLKALEIEKKLLEKRNIRERNKINSDVSKNETSSGEVEDSVHAAFIAGKKSSENERFNVEEDDKENDAFNTESKSVDVTMSAAKTFKSPLSERTLLHSNSSDPELHPTSSKEAIVEDEAFTIPTDSTDIQQYLDSTLGDSSDVGSNFDHSENFYLVGNDQEECEPIPHVSALLTLESKLASLKFSPVVDLSKDIPELILQGNSNSFLNSLGEVSSERVDILSRKIPNFQGCRTELTPVPCLKITSSPKKDAEEMKPSSLDDSHVKTSLESTSEIKTVPSSFGDNSPKSPPKLVRRGSYTLDSPSPTLLANIHKYSIDDLPKSGIRSEASQDLGQGKEVQPPEKSASENGSDSVKISEKKNKNHLESIAKTKTSKLATKGRSVFERLAADAARKVEARKKLIKEGTFKVPEIKKVSKSIKGLRSSVSINNIRASVTEAHKKRSNSSIARRCNSDVNIPYTVVRAITKSNPAASVQSLKRQSSVDLDEASSLQKSPSRNATQVDAVAAQKRKRRRWSERWEGWTKAVEPIHRNTRNVKASGKDEKVLEGVEVAKGSESLEETPNLSTDKSASTLSDHLTEVKAEEREIDLCLNNMSEIKDANKNLCVKVSEINVTSVDGKDMGCLAESFPMKEKKDNDNLQIAKQSSQGLHLPTVFPDIQENNVPISGEEESQSLNNTQKETPEVNVIHIINEERKNNEFQVPETPQQVDTDSTVLLESDSTITESACAADASFDLSLKISPSKNLINRDGPSSTRKIPLDLQCTIESLPGTPIGRQSAKDIALNILSRVIEEQDKAMQNLLEENRKREENVQKKFQEQLKYLVGRLTRLVQAMPSPQIKDGTSVQISQKSESDSGNLSSNEEICLLSPSSIIIGTQSPSQPNLNCGNSLKVASTPLQFTGVKEKERSSPVPELLTSPSKSVDSKCTIGVEDNTLDTNRNQNDTLKSPSAQEDVTNVTCSPCHEMSTSSKSCASFVRETNIHSSTLKDDSKTIKETLDDRKSDAIECFSLREEDVTNSSPGGKQKISKRLSNKEFYDSNSEVTLHDLKSSTAIEGCKCQNVDLDLSGILEMEYQGKNISYFTTQSVPSNPLHETCSSSLSSVTDSKIQMNYGFLIDELTLHRKKYEEDVLRLDIAESTPRCPTKMFSNSEAVITPFSVRKDNGMEEWQIYSKRSTTENVTKSGIRPSIRTELPDLKSDVIALRTYLGAETPSTGPVTLETPLSTPACKLEGKGNSQIASGNKLAANDYLHVSHDQKKETSFLPLKPNGEENYVDFGCDPQASMPSTLSSPGRKSESLTDAKYLTPESCSSSVNYVSAISGSLVCHPVGDNSKSEDKKGYSKLSALVKGYLTRRLLKTARVVGIKATIQDSIETALKLHSEVSEEQDVAAADVLLHGRILAQLSAAYNELHHIFFELPVKEQMAIISNDRQRLHSRNSTPTMYDPFMGASPRPALLSAVTLKTLQRRFGNGIPATNDAAVVPAKKKECLKSKEKSVAASNAKFNSVKLKDSSNHQRPTRAKSFTGHSVRQSVKKTEATKNTVIAPRKTVSGKFQQKNNTKRRRSSSTGELNRRPWR